MISPQLICIPNKPDSGYSVPCHYGISKDFTPAVLLNCYGENLKHVITTLSSEQLGLLIIKRLVEHYLALKDLYITINVPVTNCFAGLVLSSIQQTYEIFYTTDTPIPMKPFDFATQDPNYVKYHEYLQKEDIEAKIKICSAIAWLRSQSLIAEYVVHNKICYDTKNGSLVDDSSPTSKDKCFVITEQAINYSPFPEFPDYMLLRKLSRDILEPEFLEEGGCYSLYLSRSYNYAIQDAYECIAKYVKDNCKDTKNYGQKLIRDALNENNGIFKLDSDDNDQRQGWSNLVSGAFAVFRNPSTHKGIAVNFSEDDSVEAISLANYILRNLKRLADLNREQAIFDDF